MMTSSISTQNLMVLLLLTVACLAGLTSAGGKKDYEEECSMLSQVGNIFTSDKNDDPEACNTDKGLICVASKCHCGPGKVYQKGILGGIFGGGTCVGASNRPCLGGKDGATPCVANAKCGDGDSGASLCFCNDGYTATSEGYCSSGAVNVKSVGMTPIYILGLILSYYTFAH